MDNNIPLIGTKTPEEVVSRGQLIVGCYMDGNAFAWTISNEVAKRLAQVNADMLINQFRQALRETCAKNGNVLK